MSAAHDVGTKLGSRYVTTRLLGEGAAGRVYAARNVEDGSLVAAKVLKAQLGPEVRRALVDEAELLQRLRHPNIVAVHELVIDREAAIIMELVDGASVRARLHERGNLPIGEAVDLGRQLLSALDHAHTGEASRPPVIHRDVKPENLLLRATGQPRLVLTDFGIAKLVVDRTITSTMAGTFAYMAPELSQRRAPSAAGDVYGAGVTLYEMLAGHVPFGDDPMAVVTSATCLPPGLPALPH